MHYLVILTPVISHGSRFVWKGSKEKDKEMKKKKLFSV